MAKKKDPEINHPVSEELDTPLPPKKRTSRKKADETAIETQAEASQTAPELSESQPKPRKPRKSAESQPDESIDTPPKKRRSAAADDASKNAPKSTRARKTKPDSDEQTDDMAASSDDASKNAPKSTRARKTKPDSDEQTDDKSADESANVQDKKIWTITNGHNEEIPPESVSVDSLLGGRKLTRPKGRVVKPSAQSNNAPAQTESADETHVKGIVLVDQNGQSVAPEDVTADNLLGGRKLTRSKGRMIYETNHDASENRGSYVNPIIQAQMATLAKTSTQLQIGPDEEPPAFEAKKLDSSSFATQFIQPNLIPGMIAPDFLFLNIRRKPGQRLTLSELEAKHARCSGLVRADVHDRSQAMADSDLAEEIDPPISLEKIDILYRTLQSIPFRHAFETHLLTFIKITPVDWYKEEPQEPDQKEDERHFVAKDAKSPLAFSPLRLRDVAVPDTPPNDLANDPVIQSIFTIFDLPIEPLIVGGSDEMTRYRAHLDNHLGRITALLCDWARSLSHIDNGVRGGHEDKLLSKCFMDYFQRILTIHWAAARRQNIILADDRLRERYNLDTVDLLILWMLVGLESDPSFRNELTANWSQQTVVFLSAGTIMRFMASTAAERTEILKRVSPSGYLASHGLLRMVQNAAPNMSLYYEIIGSEQVRNMFCGVVSLSLSSTQFAELQFPQLPDDTFVAKSHQKTLDIVENYCTRPNLSQIANLDRDNLNFVPSMGFLVEGLPGSGRATLIKIIASRMHVPIIIVQCNPLVAIHPTDCEEFLKSVFNDAALMQGILCLRDAGALLTDERMSAALARQLARYPVVCALCVDLAVKTLPVIDPYITFKAKMDADLRDNAVSIWAPHLALPHIDKTSVNMLLLTQTMALQPFQIQKATKLAYYSTNIDNAQEIVLSNEKLERSAAIQVTKNIGNLAFVTEPEITLDDVIVSDDIMGKIQQIIGSAINRRRVLYEWGLSRRIRRGTGVIALFDGEPGTGKTHSAEAIAKSLGLSLMRINIATMVDKYIGETEKNLTTIFEQARPDMQLLLFDEADSLFTKRTSNVSKSNDRYSNMSINVLLQLVERYEGVSILTTNLKNAIDPAFERRITYKVYFPMPKKPERERLWRYMCPPDILTAEPIDYEWLSDLEMSGGEIKNAVLTAAFQAATKGVLLDSEILYDAGVSEASAAGRVMRRYDDNGDEMFQ